MLEQITSAIAQFGDWGIAFLMLLENVIPPIPSELIMPLAGFAVLYPVYVSQSIRIHRQLFSVQ
ncbi:MAG: hypothetical protein AAFQ95_19290, partial [Cyanobacteria bacterium J06621_3]